MLEFAVLITSLQIGYAAVLLSRAIKIMPLRTKRTGGRASAPPPAAPIATARPRL
jgi:hypothetical protein